MATDTFHNISLGTANMEEQSQAAKCPSSPTASLPPSASLSRSSSPSWESGVSSRYFLQLPISSEHDSPTAAPPAVAWPSTPSPRHREVRELPPSYGVQPQACQQQRTKLNGKAKAFVPGQPQQAQMSFMPVMMMYDAGYCAAPVEKPADVTEQKEEVTSSTPIVTSKGSELHGTGACKPCAWVWKSPGCVNGADCDYCHLCSQDELKLRKKVKLLAIREARASKRVL
eukprot:TRINITY_DN78093_c0_g1_i1.p1 TRINITY_DN78093_c0_g1~~TRINITY_DN78093_c0_g1_i1.p1  ORF type:complete len:228 (-),score=23.88 TRINITY_DN78093_c0_g1_i1:39-722(-)